MILRMGKRFRKPVSEEILAVDLDAVGLFHIVHYVLRRPSRSLQCMVSAKRRGWTTDNMFVESCYSGNLREFLWL